MDLLLVCVSVEAAGGKALACVVDIRDEQQIEEAVQKAVDKFGGMKRRGKITILDSKSKLTVLKASFRVWGERPGSGFIRGDTVMSVGGKLVRDFVRLTSCPSDDIIRVLVYDWQESTS